MSLSKKIIILLVALVLGYGFGRYLQPAEVITKTEIKEKVVEVEVEKVKTEYRTIVKEIERPDGTKIKETIKEEIKDESSVVKKEEKKEVKKDKKIVNIKPQWRVQAMADLSTLDDIPQYKIGVERRIFGPVFAGAYTSTDFKQYGVSISMEF